MKKHLDDCEARKAYLEKRDRRRCFHILVTGTGYFGFYWLHAEIPVKATLKVLDQFLREVWLECCGHLSAFEIEGVRYASCPDDEYGLEEKPMNITLAKVLTDNKFTYEYDYGTTTELELEILEEYEGGTKGRTANLMAKNEPPDLRCCHCGAEAVYICCECYFDGEGLMCKNCTENHECGVDMSLPVVNSPRTGACGYTGERFKKFHRID